MVGDWKFPGSWFTKEPGAYYDKQNMDQSTCAMPMGCAKSQDWLPTKVEAWHGSSSDEDLLTIALTLPSEAHVVYGAPHTVWITLSFATATPVITADIRWIGKTATRLPEATLFMLPLSPCPMGTGWSLDKVGSPTITSNAIFLASFWPLVSPSPHLDCAINRGSLEAGWRLRMWWRLVVQRTSTQLATVAHAVPAVHKLCTVRYPSISRPSLAQGSLTHTNMREIKNLTPYVCSVVGLDSALFSVGRASAFPTPLDPLSPAEASSGLTALLHNNL